MTSLAVAPKMTSLVGAGSYCVMSDHERLFSELVAPTAVGIYLMKLMLATLLLLVLVEFVGDILKYLLKFTAVAVSVYLAVIVYLASFVIVAGPVMLGQPLEHAILWQKKTMQMMNSYLLAGLY